jgi:hypothetical protein
VRTEPTNPARGARLETAKPSRENVPRNGSDHDHYAKHPKRLAPVPAPTMPHLCRQSPFGEATFQCAATPVDVSECRPHNSSKIATARMLRGRLPASARSRFPTRQRAGRDPARAAFSFGGCPSGSAESRFIVPVRSYPPWWRRACRVAFPRPPWCRVRFGVRPPN